MDWQTAALKLLQIAAYEREISKLREELLKEIGHLEERKEEAVKAAASCSAEHFQNLQDQFFSKYNKAQPHMFNMGDRCIDPLDIYYNINGQML